LAYHYNNLTTNGTATISFKDRVFSRCEAWDPIIPINWCIPSTFNACCKPDLGLSTSYVVVVFVFSEFSEGATRVVDISCVDERFGIFKHFSKSKGQSLIEMTSGTMRFCHCIVCYPSIVFSVILLYVTFDYAFGMFTHFSEKRTAMTK
jgi:hypothetical protein